MRYAAAAAVLVSTAAVLSAQGTSRWVYPDAKRRLQYTADARGNRIIFFSHAGYKGGGVRIPDGRIARTVKATAGDNTAQIQAAIDEVSKLALDTTGFRDVVLLGRGTYDVAGSIRISASGIVLRGSGVGDGRASGIGLPRAAPGHNEDTMRRAGHSNHRSIDARSAGADCGSRDDAGNPSSTMLLVT